MSSYVDVHSGIRRSRYYAPQVRKLVKAVRHSFVEDRPEFDRMQGHAEAVGRTDAASEIAQLIAAAVEPAPRFD